MKFEQMRNEFLKEAKIRQKNYYNNNPSMI